MTREEFNRIWDEARRSVDAPQLLPPNSDAGRLWGALVKLDSLRGEVMKCIHCGNETKPGEPCPCCGNVTGEKKPNPKQKGKPNA